MAKNGGGLPGLISRIVRLYDRIPHDVIAILARVVIGLVFWLSGRTKVDGFALKSSTIFLFQNEYKVPLLPPEVAAYMATFAEHMCPLLLWLGLATRFSATALLLMTLVIQTFVYPDAYVTHGLWATGLLYLMARGPGAISLDHLIARRFGH
ncbi:MAG: DoxX family protein [Hyphomicrobiales bacterium]